MALIQVFDPPMCCSTGICGPSVDPKLPRFAADLEWLKGQGVDVQRYNLAQQPQAFAENELVKKALAEAGSECLPLILVDGEVVSRGVYLPGEDLAALVGIVVAEPESLYTQAVEELVALGAAIGANCEPCFQYHFREARKAGVSRDDIVRAVATAKNVKETATDAILKVAGRNLAAERDEEMLKTVPCCMPGTASSSGKCC